MDKNNWIGLTLGEVIEQCKCHANSISYIDDPPGKLRALKILCETEGDEQNIVLEIDYNNILFSTDRKWSFDLLKEQKVVNVYLPGESFLW